jgi:membrane-associated phospholipid phosphatase
LSELDRDRYFSQSVLSPIVFGLITTSLPQAPTITPPARGLDFRAYELAPEIDLPIAGLAASLATAYFLMNQNNAAGRSCDSTTCVASTIRGLDRVAIGRDSESARDASDITMMASLATPLFLELATLRSGQKAHAEGLLSDAVVLSEVFAISYLSTSILKGATSRARPWVYSAGRPVLADSTPDAFHSFPSGHTSMAFAGAVAGCSLYVRRMDPSFGEGAAMCLPGIGLAAATAMLRVEGGRHFPTDVLAGAAIGIATGLLIPWLHSDPRADAGWSPSVMTTGRGAMVGIGGTF